MPAHDPDSVVKDLEALRALYDEPLQRSLLKELDHLSPLYQQFIAAAPFVVIASVGPRGVDISPRGDAPGFVRASDAHTLLLPDRRGNNRLDTLTNVVEDGRLSLFFMIPGIGETLRVVGRGRIVTDAGLLAGFAVQNKPPVSVLVVSVERAYYQCQKAIARSGLWQAESQPPRETVPTGGQMLEAIDAGFDGAAYDSGYPEYMRKTLY